MSQENCTFLFIDLAEAVVIGFGAFPPFTPLWWVKSAGLVPHQPSDLVRLPNIPEPHFSSLWKDDHEKIYVLG